MTTEELKQMLQEPAPPMGAWAAPKWDTTGESYPVAPHPEGGPWVFTGWHVLTGPPVRILL